MMHGSVGRPHTVRRPGARTASVAHAVEVRANGDGSFTVTTGARAGTTHRVTVAPALLDELRAVDPTVTAEILVTESFAFLLEREPPTSILREFDLGVITRYFPEYVPELQRRLAAG